MTNEIKRVFVEIQQKMGAELGIEKDGVFR